MFAVELVATKYAAVGLEVADTTPLVAWSNPLVLPIVRIEVKKEVEVALVEVELVVTKFRVVSFWSVVENVKVESPPNDPPSLN